MKKIILIILCLCCACEQKLNFNTDRIITKSEIMMHVQSDAWISDCYFTTNKGNTFIARCECLDIGDSLKKLLDWTFTRDYQKEVIVPEGKILKLS